MEFSELENEMLDSEKTAQEKKEELKKYLFNLRKKTQNQINNYNKKEKIKQKKLTEINKQICLAYGHNFTPWEEKEDKYLDRSWYYTRICQICGKMENSEDEPKDYAPKIYKRTR